MNKILIHIFITVLNMSLTASIVTAAVLALRLVLRRAPRVFSYALWAVVLFRLLCPVSFTSSVSLLGFWQTQASAQGRMNYIPEEVSYGQASDPLASAVLSEENADIEASPAAGSVSGKNGRDNAIDAASAQPWLFIGAHLWALGVLAFLTYGAVSFLRLRGKLRSAVPVSGCPHAADARTGRGRRAPGNLYQIDGLGTPFVCGLIRPRIYLPSGMEPEQADYIILHEQIHIRRGDHLFRLLAFLALCLHWFNPLVWLACSLSERDMEMSCDEAVLRQLGNGIKKAYSASLLTIAAGKDAFQGIPLAFGEREPESRIKNVLRYRRPAAAVVTVVCLICLLAAAVLLANPRHRADGGKDAPVYYGIVKTSSLETGSPYSVLIPGLGEMEIPEAETVEPYIEIDFAGLEAGQLVRITFPQGTGEPDSGRFASDAESIQVIGVGFDLVPLDDGRYLFTVPIGMARNAQEGDGLLLFRQQTNTENVPLAPFLHGNGNTSGGIAFTSAQDGAAPLLFAQTRVVAVDAGQYDIWVTLSAEEVTAFLTGFGSGVFCELDRSAGPSVLTPDMLRDNAIPDGSYVLYPRSLSRSARGLDLYIVSEWPDGEEMPFLPFAEDCTFLINQGFENLRYEETDFEEFADCLSDGLTWLNPPVHVIFTDGQISQAALESAHYRDGISYMPASGTDSWYDDLPGLTGQPTSADALAAYYQLERTETADVSDARGAEQIEVYTGNIGDGESGIVRIHYGSEDAGDLVYSLSAHYARAGWNNIYVGELDETGYLLTVHIENRDVFGEYSYQVFRLGEEGQIRQIAGSSFRFMQDRVAYNEDAFRQWCRNLETWLLNSRLLLSTQEGEMRTEPVSDADRYSFQTLRPASR